MQAAGAFGLVPMEQNSAINLESSSEGSGSESSDDDTVTTHQPSMSGGASVPDVVTAELKESEDGVLLFEGNAVQSSPSTRRSETPTSSAQLLSPSGSGSASANTPKPKRGMSSKGLTKGIADHEGLRAAKAMKKAEEEFAKRKREEEARKLAMETMDAQAVAQDEEHQQVTTQVYYPADLHAILAWMLLVPVCGSPIWDVRCARRRRKTRA